MRVRKKQKQKAGRSGFIRRTVTIPGEIVEFADAQAAKPEHAGNFSSYVRGLILRARNERAASDQAAPNETAVTA